MQELSELRSILPLPQGNAMITMKKILSFLAILLAGCDSFTFHTNLDPYNFREYYKPSTVSEVSDAQLAGSRYTSLGLVEGLACQANEQDYIATPGDARTDARIKAANLGANAIQFRKCVKLEDTPACKVSVTCYAEAFKLEEKGQQGQQDQQEE